MPKFTPLGLNPGLSGQGILVALLTSLATTSRLQWLQMGNCSMSRAKLARSVPPVHLGPERLSPASLGAEPKVKTQMFTLRGGMQGLRDTGSSGAQGGMWPGDSLWVVFACSLDPGTWPQQSGFDEVAHATVGFLIRSTM